jgi:hypothetical protein
MKNYNDTIGKRTRDLRVCSVVPQPTAPPRAPGVNNNNNAIIIIIITLATRSMKSPVTQLLDTTESCVTGFAMTMAHSAMHHVVVKILTTLRCFRLPLRWS